MLQGFSLCPLFCGVFKPQRAPVASTCLHSKEALRGAPQNRAPSSKEHNLRSADCSCQRASSVWRTEVWAKKYFFLHKFF